MTLLDTLVNKLAHQGQSGSQQGGGGYSGGGYGEQQYGGQQYPPQQGSPYGGQPQYGSQGPPQVPPPWIAEWDGPANRWIFINRETGQRTFEHPYSQQGGSGYGGYNNQGGGYGGGPQQGGYYNSSQQPYERAQFAGGGYYEAPAQPPSQKESHTGRNVALGAVAGVAGGALLMHEGEELKQDFEGDKYRLESEMNQGIMNTEQNVENFPENAARWTGEKVQDVEDIPQDIENKWDNAVQDVEDVPEDVAGWAGDKVGDVERFGDDVDNYGDRLDNAYDQGRDEERYDDDNGGDW